MIGCDFDVLSDVEEVWVKAYVAFLPAGCSDSGQKEMSRDSQRVGVP